MSAMKTNTSIRKLKLDDMVAIEPLTNNQKEVLLKCNNLNN